MQLVSPPIRSFSFGSVALYSCSSAVGSLPDCSQASRMLSYSSLNQDTSVGQVRDLSLNNELFIFGLDVSGATTDAAARCGNFMRKLQSSNGMFGLSQDRL